MMTTANTNTFEAETAADELAAILGETAADWKQREDDSSGNWHAAISDAKGVRCELTAAIIPGGVEVSSRVAEWETPPTATSRDATERYLRAAQTRLRFARYVLDPQAAIAKSFAAADVLDVELPESIAAVVTASKVVRAEVLALQDEHVAKEYLSLPGERGAMPSEV